MLVLVLCKSPVPCRAQSCFETWAVDLLTPEMSCGMQSYSRKERSVGSKVSSCVGIRTGKIEGVKMKKMPEI
jgi:hypothetical protein